MPNFKFEDYRQPWETGPHWELKREFIEKYSDMFPEDRLLCLAQAYSNVVLMNCRYPDPVMRQISLLSKPLEMHKSFQGNTDNTTETPKGEQQRVAEKMKSIYEDSGRPFKQVKFCTSTEQSPVSSQSVFSNENMLKQLEPTSDLQMVTEKFPSQVADFISVMGNYQSQDICTSPVSQVKQIELQLSEEEMNVLSTLGLELIQNFAQQIRNFQIKFRSPVESISYAGQKLKLLEQIAYEIFQTSFLPDPPIFCSKLSIKNCLISVESDESKKKAKHKSAESAIDRLIKLATSGSQALNACANKANNSFTDDLTVEKFNNVDQNIDDMKVLKMFSKKITCRNKEIPILVSLKSIAESLNMQNQIAFDILQDSQSEGESIYVCKFFIKNILISDGKHTSINQAKFFSVKSGFSKLMNLSKFQIENFELREYQNNAVSESSNTTTCNLNHSLSEASSKDVNENTPFVLNKDLFNSSLSDAFVLVDNLSLKPAHLRHLRTLLSESINFCRKTFEYRFEEILGTIPPSKRAEMVIADKVFGTGIAFSKEEAKILASHNAVDTLRKMYYTLKVKNEYIDGYIISRNQVFEGESFSSGALTENNIGCKMLKNMGWTGGGLGASGISDPVEAQGHHSFGSGLGYGRSMNDLRLFKRRIESMLQDYSKTNTLSDLVFSKEFTKEERKEIHKMAGKFHLHTASRGANEDRFLTVRHKYNVTQILQYLVQNGGTSSKFELVDASEKQFEL